MALLPSDGNDQTAQFADSSGNAAPANIDTAGNLRTTIGPSAGINWGTVVVTTIAASLPSQICLKASVQNSVGSASTILIGNSAGQSWEISLGGALVDIPVNNLNLLWVKVASGSATLHWETA